VICRADEHYKVQRYGSGGQIQFLRCIQCEFSVNVKSLHRSGDKSGGAGRYCRARAQMVKHWHAQHIGGTNGE